MNNSKKEQNMYDNIFIESKKEKIYVCKDDKDEKKTCEYRNIVHVENEKGLRELMRLCINHGMDPLDRKNSELKCKFRKKCYFSLTLWGNFDTHNEK